MSFFRIQANTFPATDILLPENQLSISWTNQEGVRQGISACESREELATYIAQTGISWDDSWILVEMDGDYADEDDEDADLGAVLTIPDTIISIEPIADAFIDEIFAAHDELAAA